MKIDPHRDPLLHATADHGIALLQNQSLAPLTTMGIGGDARFLLEAHTLSDLRQGLDWAKVERLPVLVLGGGSNMLVADSGWPGLVIMLRIRGFDITALDDSTVQIVAGAGENWDDLVRLSVDQKLQGIECLSGIPGTVGASPIQNIGAYGQEVKDTIAWVEAMDRSTGELHIFSAAKCEFSYRWSRFKGADQDRYIVTRVAFHLHKNAQPSLRYGDLTRYFDQRQIESPELSDVREAVLSVRRSKGMVVDPAIPDSRSCGSFFMNPIVSHEEAEKVKAILLRDRQITSDDKFPIYPVDDRQVKLSAAYLMEMAGLEKGFRLGNVGLSTRHVLALINCGDGTSKEILALIEHVKDRVRSRFELELHPEPVFVGFSNPPFPDGCEA